MASEMELQMSRLLQAGVILSAAIMLSGGVLYLVHPPAHPPDYAHFHAAAMSFRRVGSIVGGALHLDALSLIQLGTLSMIATPIARVLFAALAFARERDGLYVAICLVILALLGYGIVLDH